MTDKIRLFKIILEKDFCFGITAKGDVYSWGSNELGLNQKDSHFPKRVEFFENKFIFNIITTPTHCFAICRTGKLYAWGYTQFYDVLGIDKTSKEFISPKQVPFKFFDQIEKVYTLSKTSFAITSARKVYSWGTNIKGNLGYENLNYLQRQSTPREIGYFNNLNINELYVFDSNCYAVSLDGKVYEWSGENSVAPRQNEGLKGVKIKKILYGFDDFYIALSEDGFVYSWGNNDYGCLGIGRDQETEAPVKIEGLKNVCDIFVGDNISFALLHTGELQFWGKNEFIHFWNTKFKIIYYPEPIVLNKSIIDLQALDLFYCRFNLLSSKIYYLIQRKSKGLYFR